VLTESRQRSSESSRSSGRLSGRLVEDDGDTRQVAGDAYGVRYSRWFGELSLKTTGRMVSRFGPQNLSGCSEEEQDGT
jgi:hypothetical protein